jgi:hypothetical protein
LDRNDEYNAQVSVDKAQTCTQGIQSLGRKNPFFDGVVYNLEFFIMGLHTGRFCGNQPMQ